jgi:Methyltransferase domain
MTAGHQINSEYDRHQYSHNYPEGIENYFWSMGRVDIICRTLRDAATIGLRSETGRVLEVGCAVGVVVAGLLKAGFDIWGVDLGRPTPLKVAEHRIQIGIKAQHLDEDFRATIETLMLLDVIEHIEDDVTFLREMLVYFPRCTCVIIAVPARAEAWSKWDEYYGHYRRYTAESVEHTIRQAGFVPLRARYFFRSLYVVTMLINLLGIERSITVRPPTKPSLFHRFIASLLILEDKILHGSWLPGLSLICLASRVGPTEP